MKIEWAETREPYNCEAVTTGFLHVDGKPCYKITMKGDICIALPMTASTPEIEDFLWRLPRPIVGGVSVDGSPENWARALHEGQPNPTAEASDPAPGLIRLEDRERCVKALIAARAHIETALREVGKASNWKEVDAVNMRHAGELANTASCIALYSH